jgi:hypothetical protein
MKMGGHTIENNKLSGELRSMRVPLMSRQNCLSHLPPNFETYLTSETLCAGYQNGNALRYCSLPIIDNFIIGY